MKALRRLAVIMTTVFALALVVYTMPQELLSLLRIMETAGAPASGGSPDSAAGCSPLLLGAHGFSKEEGQPSAKTINAGMELGMRGVQLDLIFLRDTIVLDRRDIDLKPEATLSDYRQYRDQPYTLDRFFADFGRDMNRVLLHVKESFIPAERMVELLQFAGVLPGRDILIGEDCYLMQFLRKQTGLPAGCTSHGLIGTRYGNFDVWTSYPGLITPRQLAWNRYWRKTLILLQVKDLAAAAATCHLRPDMAVVKRWEP